MSKSAVDDQDDDVIRFGANIVRIAIPNMFPPCQMIQCIRFKILFDFENDDQHHQNNHQDLGSKQLDESSSRDISFLD